MIKKVLFPICMLIIACLSFVAADCSTCKKSDPNYPDCNPQPPPPPQPTVEKWMLMAVGDYDENRPDISRIVYFSYSDGLILKLWSNGKWYHKYLEDDYDDGIYKRNFYVLPNGDTCKYIDFYVIRSGDTILDHSHGVRYADRYETNPPFTIPVPIVHAIDSLQLNSTVMEFAMEYPMPFVPQFMYYVKMQ